MKYHVSAIFDGGLSSLDKEVSSLQEVEVILQEFKDYVDHAIHCGDKFTSIEFEVTEVSEDGEEPRIECVYYL